MASSVGVAFSSNPDFGPFLLDVLTRPLEDLSADFLLLNRFLDCFFFLSFLRLLDSSLLEGRLCLSAGSGREFKGGTGDTLGEGVGGVRTMEGVARSSVTWRGLFRPRGSDLFTDFLFLKLNMLRVLDFCLLD